MHNVPGVPSHTLWRGFSGYGSVSRCGSSRGFIMAACPHFRPTAKSANSADGRRVSLRLFLFRRLPVLEGILAKDVLNLLGPCCYNKRGQERIFPPNTGVGGEVGAG
jgi:hypothetical protein